MRHWPTVQQLLADAGIHLQATRAPRGVSGGDISDAWRASTTNGDVFIKSGPAGAINMFTAERDALLELANAGPVRVPHPLLAAAGDGISVLVLEWLDLAPATSAIHHKFGLQLAALHRHAADTFGWQRDNTIGATPQPNPKHDDWPVFFRDYRLRHQLQLAGQKGFAGKLQTEGAWLCDNLAALFSDYTPRPSLLHGDLWGGNWGSCNGEPVMFDPATYYGDRETDLAMTRLFGGFRRDFYDAYEDAWPLAAGAGTRVLLYQLYHVLNHLNLFGRGYERQALGLMADLRRAIVRLR